MRTGGTATMDNRRRRRRIKPYESVLPLITAYRFSISWSRLIPRHPKDVKYYNNLINELISYVEPRVTLHYSDLPQALDEECGGWVSRKTMLIPNIYGKDFTASVDAHLKNFEDRVLHWTAMNEPNVFILGG
ncbi:beta-glucosidase 11-like isoform X1 [Pyrus x bretschneideri]|uniref:beta-glucosidase 11-like isoform X1 n=1 Tax=Pyrus x bretschneideri TaxID=225117 RepID=UPI00203013E8|nr:beta-glucosidase 11-like isoform X1 [Pyrus x bretschneideri]